MVIKRIDYRPIYPSDEGSDSRKLYMIKIRESGSLMDAGGGHMVDVPPPAKRNGHTFNLNTFCLVLIRGY